MSDSRPDVLLLTVDTLRADRLGAYGYDRPTSPNLDRFAEGAIVCDTAYTLGPFTQVACIQLFTSSRPFSYGGYDRGAAGRPTTIFKHFRDHGYHTWGLSTIHWVSPYYGYTDGLDEENGVFHLNTLVGMAAMNMRDTLRLYHEGRFDHDEMLATAAPIIRRLFENVDDYCAMSTARGDDYRRHFPDSKIVNDKYVFSRVKAVVARHRDAFERDPLGYVHRHLGSIPQAHEWLSRDWRYCRTMDKLLSEAALRITNRFLAKASPRLAGQRAAKYRFAVDAHAIAARVVKQLRDRPIGKPSFIWAHFKDTHQPFVSGSGRHWYRQTPKYLAALGHPTDIDPSMVFRGRPKTDTQWAQTSALYDAAVRSTDEAIGAILGAVDALGLADNVIIGFAGDHGEEIGEHGDYGHQVMLYDHNARIPMMFRSPDLSGSRLDALVTSLDWAPTVTALAGLKAAPGWVGRPVTSPEAAARDHVLLETFCRGNCIFEHRPLYMAVRTRHHKYLWKEYVDPTHSYGKPGHELYDLDTDPLERDNLYWPDHPVVAGLDPLIARRMAEIPAIPDQRIIDNFGTVGTEAVAAVRRQPGKASL